LLSLAINHQALQELAIDLGIYTLVPNPPET
jgi:hypothetical protein